MADFKEIQIGADGQVYQVKDETARNNAGGYTPPDGGIPKTDLAPVVQTSLGLADTALQAADKAQLQSVINAVQTALAGKISGIKANGASTTLPVDQNGVVELPPAGSTISPASAAPSMDGTANVGSSAKYAREDHVHPHDTSKANDADVVKSISVNGTSQTKDSSGNVNIDAYTKAQTEAKIADAVDGIEAGETVVINSDGANIVDEHDNNSVLLAPSARQMKLMYNNIMAIYNGLANIAFTNGKPTLDWIGSKTKYTLSYGTMTGCTADVEAGQVNEGALRIKLTPAQASYAFTSVTVNGESASTTATGDADGSVYLDIVVNGNVTVAATAISGRGIDFTGSTGCSIGAAGVAIGQDLDTTITANEHFTLPASITVKIGNANVTHTYTKQSNTTASLHIDAAYITGNLTITCTADEEDHAVLNLANVGSGVTVDKANNAHLYAGDTIHILPATSDKKVTITSFTVGGNSATLDGDTYAGYSYTIQPTDVSSSGTAIAITASGEALRTFNIDLSGLVGVTSSNAADSILEGSPYSTTLSKTDASVAGSVIIGTCTMGNEDITPPSGSTISVAHVTGHIVIAASVGVQPSIIHSYDMAIDTDANNKRYIADTGDMGSFPLYNSADVGFDTETFGSGWYGNGSYTPNRNGGFVKYGNPALGLSAGDDFSVVLRDLFVYPKAQNINPPMTIGYNDGQVRIKFYPEREVNRNLDSEVGQFELSVWRNATSGAIGNGDYVQLNIKKWTLNTSYFGSSGKFPCTREKIAGTDTYTHTYHLMMTFVASTLKATAYLIDIDNVNNTVTVTNGGSLTMEANLKITGLGFKKMSELGGLDIYNYAVAENNIAGLFTNNN